MCSTPGRLVVAQLAQRPERVAQRAGGDEHDLAVALGDRVAERAAEAQVVLGVRGLADPDRHPALVRQPVAEELPEVGGGVEDRQVVVVDRGDPGAVVVRLRGDQAGELGVAREVVRPPAHAAGQLLGGEQARAPVLRGHDELDRGRPVRVEDDDGVVVEGVEDLAAQLLQAGHQRDVLAVVQLPADLLRQHDRRDVREQTRADDLTHGLSFPSPSASRSSRSARTRCS